MGCSEFWCSRTDVICKVLYAKCKGQVFQLNPMLPNKFKTFLQTNYIVIHHMSCVTCHMLWVTCHQHQQPQPQTLTLLTPPLCTVGWVTKTETKTQKRFQTQKSIETFNKKGVLNFTISANALQFSRCWLPTKGTQNISASHGHCDL